MGTQVCLEFDPNKQDIALKVSHALIETSQESGGTLQKFTFDRIFDTDSNQKEVYDIAARPIIESK